MEERRGDCVTGVAVGELMRGLSGWKGIIEVSVNIFPKI